MLKHIPKKSLLLFVGDALLITISLCLSFVILSRGTSNVFYTYTGASVISLFFYLFVFYMAEIYSFRGRIISAKFILKLVVSIIISNCMIAATFYVFHKWKYDRSVFFLNCAFILFYAVSWRLIFDRFFKFGRRCSNNLKRSILPIIPGSYKQFVKKIDDAQFDGTEIDETQTLYGYITGKVPISQINYSWLSYSDFYKKNKALYNLKIKVALDKIFAILIIIITLPLIIVSAIAIKLESRGSVFFTQERRGEGTKTIKIIKFRTMVQGMEEERERAGFRNDPRITGVGKILRFFRIDEIPQLWNVIKGDMSIVGPRTLMKQEVSRFSSEIPYFYIRHFVKPGITGWAQVHYKHGANAEDATEKLQYDLYYIMNLSPLLDFYIFLLTLKVVLYGRGAR
jgi:lipopolysaccharide/colanic/teichoic acid biosynthesis glycosyltransferase